DVGEGQNEETMGMQVCAFTSSGQENMALVQWAPMEAPLDTVVDQASSAFDNPSEPDEVSVDGASDAVGLTAELQGREGALVYAALDGGFTQVMVGGEEDADVDTAVALTELTLSKA